jgi:hypothetical protein
MRRFVILVLAVLCWTAVPAEESSELAVQFGGNDYIGGLLRYEDFGIRIGTYEEAVCVREYRSSCDEWGEESIDLYEALLFVPIHEGWYGYGALGLVDLETDNDIGYGVGAEWRWKHLAVTGGWQSETEWTGGLGYSAAW